MKLLIAIPTKNESRIPDYSMRMVACRETWLSEIGHADSNICWNFNGHQAQYKDFSDAAMGLTEIDQHDNAVDPIRTHRTQLMVKWAYDHEFDFIFRVDTDAYVWVNRLLKSGFEHHDYMGYCRDFNQPPYNGRRDDWCITTAHGGIGFFLSRKAMKIIIDAPVERYADGKFWGDLWTGHQLWKKGIVCKRDTRFLDGGGTGVSTHHGNILADELPPDHQYISIHPVNPIANFYAIHERFKDLPAETIPPRRQLWDR